MVFSLFISTIMFVVTDKYTSFFYVLAYPFTWIQMCIVASIFSNKVGEYFNGSVDIENNIARYLSYVFFVVSVVLFFLEI